MTEKFDYVTARQDADELIQYFGMKAVLRRATATPTDRPCVVAITEYQPRDQPSSLVNLPSRLVLVSALTPEVQAMPPDTELDVLVTFVQPDGTVEDEVLNFTRPVKPTAPAGLSVFYELVVRQ